MPTEYIDFLLKEMAPVIEVVTDPKEQQLHMVTMLTRFLHCDSLLDLAQTYQINKDALYASLDAVSPPRWLRRLMKRGRQRLLGHLQKWHAGDPSFKSRHFITLCADDFTRSARGCLGEWTGIFYSGAAKRPVIGINIEALCAVIGDGLELTLILMPPKVLPLLMTQGWQMQKLMESRVSREVDQGNGGSPERFPWGSI